MVDLNKYLGKWNEIASFPARFQEECSQVQAEYIDKGNYISVKNSCVINGKKKEIKGKAFKTDESNRLKVQFFWPFRSDYIIEHVDKEYQVAIVGSGNKNYLWILARNKSIDKELFEKLIKIARKKGYDVSRLKIARNRVRKKELKDEI